MLDYHIYDVFTDQPFSGNPLAVVMGADDLSAAQMQKIARQFNLSETIFVQAPRDPAHRARVRIFVPNAEIAFAGHPVVGCALHLMGGRDGELVLGTHAGPTPVSVAAGRAEFTAPVLPRCLPLGEARDDLAAALGLSAAQIGFGAHCPVLARTAEDFLCVPVASLAALAQARAGGAVWDRVTASLPLVYLYAPDGDGYRVRLFAPAMGIPEDPATGSAAAALPACLLAAGALKEGENHIAIAQGIEMGRPAQIGLTAVVTGGSLGEIRVSGRAAPVAQGQIRIPEDV